MVPLYWQDQQSQKKRILALPFPGLIKRMDGQEQLNSYTHCVVSPWYVQTAQQIRLSLGQSTRTVQAIREDSNALSAKKPGASVSLWQPFQVLPIQLPKLPPPSLFPLSYLLLLFPQLFLLYLLNPPSLLQILPKPQISTH